MRDLFGKLGYLSHVWDPLNFLCLSWVKCRNLEIKSRSLFVLFSLDTEDILMTIPKPMTHPVFLPKVRCRRETLSGQTVYCIIAGAKGKAEFFYWMPCQLLFLVPIQYLSINPINIGEDEENILRNMGKLSFPSLSCWVCRCGVLWLHFSLMKEFLKKVISDTSK